MRDPYTIANIDLVTAWARQQVVERFGDSGYELHFTVYGRNAILSDREPLKTTPAHELGIVVQGIAPSKAMAEEVERRDTSQRCRQSRSFSPLARARGDASQ
ncbi:MAG: hypothetical protein WA709_06695 [Stellaceae bacterium]